jgi:hypothetical protein
VEEPRNHDDFVRHSGTTVAAKKFGPCTEIGLDLRPSNWKVADQIANFGHWQLFIRPNSGCKAEFEGRQFCSVAAVLVAIILKEKRRCRRTARGRVDVLKE